MSKLFGTKGQSLKHHYLADNKTSNRKKKYIYILLKYKLKRQNYT